MLSGPALLPSLRDFLACPYSFVERGPSSMYRSQIISGMFCSVPATSRELPSKLLKWLNQLETRSSGPDAAIWPLTDFFWPLISFTTFQASLSLRCSRFTCVKQCPRRRLGFAVLSTCASLLDSS